jgi:hypothetical protein
MDTVAAHAAAGAEHSFAARQLVIIASRCAVRLSLVPQLQQRMQPQS